jgi:tetratricopeptide (TPR) repeat protein
MAIAYLDKNSFKKSLEYVYKCLKINKKYPLGLVTMGNLLFETGKPEVAIKYHKEALKINPNDI